MLIYFVQLVFSKKSPGGPEEEPSNLAYLEELYERSYRGTGDESIDSTISVGRSETSLTSSSSSTADYSTRSSCCPSPVFEEMATVAIEHLVEEAKPQFNDFYSASNSYCRFEMPAFTLKLCKMDGEHCEPEQFEVDHSLGILSHWDANGTVDNEAEEWLDILSSLSTGTRSNEPDLFGIQN